jgi:hypothetical protein
LAESAHASRERAKDKFAMGYSLSWVAVKGRSHAELQQILGLKRTGKQGDYGAHALVGRHLQDGWYILIANSSEDKIAKSKTLAQLSKGAQAVACSIEEHVMFSSCAFWNAGKKIWSVMHRGERDVFDLVKSGKPPENYTSLKQELIETQKLEGGENAGVDVVFEIPLRLAKQLVGFKHDEDETETAEEAYEIFEFNFRQRVPRAVAASMPWLYLAGVLIGVIALLAAVAIVLRSAFDWIIAVIKDFIP